MQRPLLCIFNLSFVLAWMIGCGQPESESGDTGVPQQVRLGYFANLAHAQAVLGVSSGDFARAVAPARLSTRLFNAGPSLVEALMSGNIDVGYVGPGPAINAHGKTRGHGIRIISGASANGVLIVARSDSGIDSLDDLKGRRVATPQLGNTQDLAARHFVIHQLKQRDANNVLPVANAEQAGLMVRNQIDACWTPEPWGTRLVTEANAKIIGYEKDLHPGGEVALAVVITTPQFLKRYPDVLEKLLEVHLEWTNRLQNAPQLHLTALGEALYALNNKRLPPGVLEKAIANVKFTSDPLEQTLHSMAQWSYELGFTRSQTQVTGLIDLTVLNRVKEK